MESRPPLSLLEEFCAWSRAELEETETWRETLSDNEIEALTERVRRLTRAEGDVAPMAPADILSSELRGRIPALSDALVFGRGFFIVRRLPLERLSQAEAEQLFRALAGHFGRIQAGPDNGEAAPIEGCGFIAAEHDGWTQLCLRAPSRGGEIRLVSAVALHNEMLRCRPDLLRHFYAPIGHSRPLFSVQGQRLETHIDPEFAMLAADGGASELVEDHRQAFALFHALVEELALDVDFEPGDALFVNAHRVLVAQGTHENYTELGKGHALLRLSLVNERWRVQGAPGLREPARAQAAA
jgi:hypothetical protein